MVNDLGWGVQVPARLEGAGIAVRYPDGWHGTPEMVARVERAGLAAALRQQAMAAKDAAVKGVPNV